LSVVVALVFLGRHVAEGAVEAPIVVPVKPVEAEFLDVSEGLQGPVMKGEFFATASFL
jgi:hypothetical protein